VHAVTIEAATENSWRTARDRSDRDAVPPALPSSANACSANAVANNEPTATALFIPVVPLSRFRFMHLIAAGTYGEVTRARLRATGRVYALKRVLDETEADYGDGRGDTGGGGGMGILGIAASFLTRSGDD